MSTLELKRIGWLGNPAVDRLYALGNTGVWVELEVSTTPVARLNLTNTGYTAARLLSGANSVADLLDDVNTALGVTNGYLATLAACVDGTAFRVDQIP